MGWCNEREKSREGIIQNEIESCLAKLILKSKTKQIHSIQIRLKNNELISEAVIHLVAVEKNGKPSKIPDELKQKLEN